MFRRFGLIAFTGIFALVPGAHAAKVVFSTQASWQNSPNRTSNTAMLSIKISVDKNWHINSNKPLEDYLIPTDVRVLLPTGWSSESPVFPPHQVLKLAFSESPVAVYEGTFTVTVPLKFPENADWPAQIKGFVEAQACNDQVCMPPEEVEFIALIEGGATPTTQVQSPVPATAEQKIPASQPPSQTTGSLSDKLARSGLLLQLVIVFFAGLALNLTPCVYPLIPITVGFFVAQREGGAKRTWLLAVMYTLGMSVTYSALGVSAALTGKLFGSAMQSPWVIVFVIVVLLALATSMFGLWELRVPSSLAALSGGKSGVFGALFMGLLVGLVAAPCIGPFVIGLLTLVGQRGDVWFGFVMFFTLALGLGLPYMLLGIFTGAINKLPNSGAWMLSIKEFFGILLLAMAGFFAKPLLSSTTGAWLFAGLLVLGGFYLLVIVRPGHEWSWIDRAMRLASAIMIVAGVLLLPRSQGEINAVTWQPYDGKAVEQAISAGKTVVIDFHAVWCIPCKELDEKTFSIPSVAKRLSQYALFDVDITRSTTENEALRQRYGAFGVPTIIFIKDGSEVVAARLTGFEPPETFLKRLNLVEGK